MTTTPPAAYAAVIHKLSLGETVTGAEVLALDGFPQLTPIEPGDQFVIGDLPELMSHIAVLAALLEDEDGEAALAVSCDWNECLGSDAMYGKPLPPRVRAILWDLASRIDMAAGLARAESNPS